MVERSLGYVFQHEGRWRVDLPGVLTGVAGAAFLTGIHPRIRQRFPWLVWGSLAAATASGAAWWLAHGAFRWDVTVDRWGVRLVNRAGEKVDLGVPCSVRQGRYDAMSSAGPLHGVILRCWVAIETDTGRLFLFESAEGPSSPGFADWPEAVPPETDDRFSSIRFDILAFRAALWSAMLR